LAGGGPTAVGKVIGTKGGFFPVFAGIIAGGSDFLGIVFPFLSPLSCRQIDALPGIWTAYLGCHQIATSSNP
jgi:hypothetical protein